jgi:hypothetical protein
LIAIVSAYFTGTADAFADSAPLVEVRWQIAEALFRRSDFGARLFANKT